MGWGGWEGANTVMSDAGGRSAGDGAGTSDVAEASNCTASTPRGDAFARAGAAAGGAACRRRAHRPGAASAAEVCIGPGEAR